MGKGTDRTDTTNTTNSRTNRKRIKISLRNGGFFVCVYEVFFGFSSCGGFMKESSSTAATMKTKPI